MHRLSRGKKSKTYEKKTDAEIAKAICADYGLTCQVKGDVNVRHDHVYQHHQTDLEFLLLRARRINYEIFVDDQTLNFRKRDVSGSEKLTLEFGAKDDSDGSPMSKFALRLSSANQVTSVKVRCWDPNTSKEIIGEAKTLDTKLGSKSGGDAAKSAFSGGVHKATYDVPVASKEEADAVAKAMLEDLSLGYMEGEGHCKGNPDLKAGIIVKIKGTDKRFDGKYYVMGATHRYSHKSGGAGGYRTIIRVRRNAEGA
jgi:phage protein D